MGALFQLPQWPLANLKQPVLSKSFENNAQTYEPIEYNGGAAEQLCSNDGQPPLRLCCYLSKRV